jgi:hypothetical protein
MSTSTWLSLAFPTNIELDLLKALLGFIEQATGAYVLNIFTKVKYAMEYLDAMAILCMHQKILSPELLYVTIVISYGCKYFETLATAILI